jgi:hypothetical protein
VRVACTHSPTRSSAHTHSRSSTPLCIVPLALLLVGLSTAVHLAAPAATGLRAVPRVCLRARPSRRQVKEDPGLGVYIAGCTEVYVTSIDECFDIMRQGGENRAVAATGMNEGSSRSHSLFIIFLSQKDSKSGIIKTGRFFLVDLAGVGPQLCGGAQQAWSLRQPCVCLLGTVGPLTRPRLCCAFARGWCLPALSQTPGSETINKTGVTGQQLEEAKKINKVCCVAVGGCGWGRLPALTLFVTPCLSPLPPSLPPPHTHKHAWITGESRARPLRCLRSRCLPWAMLSTH